jgi:hypothetical protein
MEAIDVPEIPSSVFTFWEGGKEKDLSSLVRMILSLFFLLIEIIDFVHHTLWTNKWQVIFASAVFESRLTLSLSGLQRHGFEALEKV